LGRREVWAVNESRSKESRSEEQRSFDRPSGDEDIVRRMAPRVRDWVARCIGPSPDLDDIAQEALIEVAYALPRFEGRSSIDTYCRRIATRVAIRQRKKRALPTTPHLVEVRDEGLEPDGLIAQQEVVAAVYRAMAELSDGVRLAVTLCDIEGLKHAEASEVLEVQIPALRARLKRGRGQLRVLLLADDEADVRRDP
jgi:RNA polymerase sigma-70 factor (ECF subfamily)